MHKRLDAVLQMSGKFIIADRLAVVSKTVMKKSIPESG
jgi:hypothetical protein